MCGIKFVRTRDCDDDARAAVHGERVGTGERFVLLYCIVLYCIVV